MPSVTGPRRRFRRLRAWAERHPVLIRRARLAWVVWSWASLVLFLVSRSVVPSWRTGTTPWLWSYYALFLVFVAARTKTVSWRLVALVFSAGCVLAPLIGGAEVVISGQLGLDINSQDGAVVVAGPVEETLKLLPLLGLVLFARRRVRGFATVDYLVVGFAAGMGFQVVEDAIRRIAVERFEPSGLGVLFAEDVARTPHYGFGWLDAGQFHLQVEGLREEAFYSGHAIATALIAVAIGLDRRLRRRLGPLVVLVPLLVAAMVIVDHVMFNNASSAPLIELPEIEVPDVPGLDIPDPHTVEVPSWLHTAWRTWGRGRWEAPLLTLALILGMVLDVRRVRRALPRLPPIPDVALARRVRDRADALAWGVRGSVPATAGRLVRRAAAGLAETVRWLGQTLADIIHELVLALTARARDPAPAPQWSSGSTPTSLGHRRARFLLGLTYLRGRRQLAHELETSVDRIRRRRAPPRRLAPVGSALLGILGVATVMLLGVLAGTGLGAGSDAGFLANLFEELGDWWDSLSFGEQMLLIFGTAFLLSFGFGWAFWPVLGWVGFAATVADYGHGTATFIRDPRRATEDFFRNLTPQDAAWLAFDLGLELIPGSVGAGAGSSFRRHLDDMLDTGGHRADELLEPTDDVVRAADDAVPPARQAPGNWIEPGTDPHVPRRTFGDPFNAEYEEWVRTQTGGRPGHEFRSGDVNFDSVEPGRVVDGVPTDVLVDAKGHYAQFIDPRTGGWKPFFTRLPDSGLQQLIADARRQVRASGGLPVEWWCAEESVARLLNLEFRRAGLTGIRAVFKPM